MGISCRGSSEERERDVIDSDDDVDKVRRSRTESAFCIASGHWPTCGLYHEIFEGVLMFTLADASQEGDLTLAA